MRKQQLRIRNEKQEIIAEGKKQAETGRQKQHPKNRHAEISRETKRVYQKERIIGERLMTKYVKTAILLLASATLCWAVLLFANPASNEAFLWIASIGLTIAFVCFAAICVCKKFNDSVSPYRVFAVSDSIITIGIALYAIYDITTDTGFFAGIFGAMLLIFIVPTTLAFLLIDFLVWKLHKSKESKK